MHHFRLRLNVGPESFEIDVLPGLPHDAPYVLRLIETSKEVYFTE